MPRRRPPRDRARPPVTSPSGERREQGADGEWMVRSVSGQAATKAYRCPGCRQEIPPGLPHLVTWPADPPIGAFGGIEDRRHWHRACWAARTRRR